MNYCPNCGTPVEPNWKVCANCGYKLSHEHFSTLYQKEAESQVKTVEYVKPKPASGYFKPQKTNGILALSFGIMAMSLSILIMILRLFGYSYIIIPFNVIVNLPGIIAVVFGIIGIVKDDSKGMAITGLIFGIASFIFVLIRYFIYLWSSIIPIID
ncbi:MAG: zinc ribbon domain-containing protein [Promethearchaeota archaeon]